MHADISKLVADGPVLLDGALGSVLMRYAAEGVSAMEANLVYPEDVYIASAIYRLEGSRILLTNTFQASRTALSRLGAAEVVREVNETAALLARDAAGEGALVFGDIGPSGAASVVDAADAFAEQVFLLAEAGVDGFALETMLDLEEAVAAVRAAKSTGLPVVACMAYLPGRIRPEEAVPALEDAGADVLGANCLDPAEMLPICRALRAATDRPVWIKPNAGLPSVRNGALRYPIGPRDFADGAVALVEAGADFIGGCCGVHWRHIRALAGALARRRE